MREAAIWANSTLRPDNGSAPPIRRAKWNHRPMQAGYFLVGYDRGTGEAIAYHALPPAMVEAAKSLGGIPANDPSMIGDWPLSSEAALAIAALARTKIDADHLDYCLEPHEPVPATRATHAAE